VRETEVRRWKQRTRGSSRKQQLHQAQTVPRGDEPMSGFGQWVDSVDEPRTFVGSFPLSLVPPSHSLASSLRHVTPPSPSCASRCALPSVGGVTTWLYAGLRVVIVDVVVGAYTVLYCAPPQCRVSTLPTARNMLFQHSYNQMTSKATITSMLGNGPHTWPK